MARVDGAAELLGPLGIGVRALDDDQARTILTSCTTPANLMPYGTETAGLDEIITTGNSEYSGTTLDATASDIGSDTDDAAARTGTRRGRGRCGRRIRRARTVAELAPESLTIGT
ncbi:hypothetical protein [Nocardia terpenica]|uniref:Uncharacterized protein n=1 Tax=Nocardia terpenica TaxID=455432 RepID=A0A291RRD8_9NOCA|nr:hypothetical protein [Nocardia terpenica]ATL69905.1 hypothetical protein CRH09_30760 [Nocardia terpenica]